MQFSDTVELSNGVKMPIVGFGTYRTEAGTVCVESVKYAIEDGYRHVDTAALYENEESVGDGIIASGVDRKDIFVTTKLRNCDQGYESTLKAFELSLKKLKMDYVDLYLIHWPIAFDFRDCWQETIKATWKAFEELYEAGKIKAIGVSNFLVEHLEFLQENCKIQPMVNQIEFHIGCEQSDTVEYCKENGIIVEAWSPLCKGKAFDAPELQTLVKKYNRTPSQILLRWCLQKGTVILPKSVTPSRILENTKLFDFEITAEDIAYLGGTNFVGRLGSHPYSVTF
jgi:diketogulonate reductase-like aldo/keto reductase